MIISSMNGNHICVHVVLSKFKVDKDGYITLTESGLAIADKIYQRHTLITQLLVRLGVSEETAAEDACKIEHAISDESFLAIKAYVDSL